MIFFNDKISSIVHYCNLQGEKKSAVCVTVFFFFLKDGNNEV